jgi:hypothetical protein
MSVPEYMNWNSLNNRNRSQQYYVKEGYQSNNSKYNPNLSNSSSWLPMYWRTAFIMARTFNSNDKNIKQTTSALKCFYQSLSQIIPSLEVCQIMQEFILMTPNVVNVLLTNRVLNSFFLVNKDLQQQLEKSPQTFFDWCLGESNTLFMWVYLLYTYYHILKGQSIESYNSARLFYYRSNINKQFWAHGIWFVMHFSALNAPAKLTREWSLAFKAFVCCLLYVLPCPICREHWKENLANLPIDSYLNTFSSIFEWTVAQHNSVNAMLEKPIISLDDANRLFSSI